MEWTRTETIAMASAACVFCRGLGLRYTDKLGVARPCSCVFRAIFRACLNRYQRCQSSAERIKPVTHEYFGATQGLRSYGRRNEEYIADFEAISRRILDAEEMEVLRLYFFQSKDWKFCAEKLNSNRGNIFHMVYCIEEKLGRAFRETEPYGLFPVDEYFSGAIYRRVSPTELTPGLTRKSAPAPSDAGPAPVRANVIEMPRNYNRVSRRFPSRAPRRKPNPIDQAA
jgi:hypothetical protein